MFIGLDLGTSAVKAVLVDDDQTVVDQASAPLTVSRPHPLWSEQDPDQWWTATDAAMAEIGSRQGRALSAVRGIGLSGQMHGATLLDGQDRVLRPAILWNDGRSGTECAELERREPRSRQITGNLAMPGFTAPKLLWVAAHEPDIFKRTARVLLPKDYVRLRMTGACASDMSDSAGTLWLDVAERRWSAEMVEATGLALSAMPELFEGSAPTGTLLPAVAERWGVPRDTVAAGGGGDNAAGAVGVGVIAPGAAFLSLGTSGVLFAANDGYAPNFEQAVHTFCHCLPRTWHQMSVILSAASSLSWLVQATGAADEATLLAEAEAASDRDPGRLLFLPYLSGERTPHNDPNAMGVFFGLGHGTDRADLTRAVLEGVAFAFATGLRPDRGRHQDRRSLGDRRRRALVFLGPDPGLRARPHPDLSYGWRNRPRLRCGPSGAVGGNRGGPDRNLPAAAGGRHRGSRPRAKGRTGPALAGLPRPLSDP